ACRIANNRFPYSFSVCAATLRQTARAEQLMHCSKRALRVAPQRQAVVLSAISTKSCGQVCGLSLYSAAARSCRAYRVGRDQQLSSVLSCENMCLTERIGLGSGSRPALGRPAAACG